MSSLIQSYLERAIELSEFNDVSDFIESAICEKMEDVFFVHGEHTGDNEARSLFSEESVRLKGKRNDYSISRMGNG